MSISSFTNFVKRVLAAAKIVLTCTHCHAKVTLPRAWFVRSPFGKHPCPSCGTKNRFFVSPWLITWPFYALQEFAEQWGGDIIKQSLKFTLLRCLLIFISVGLLVPLVIRFFASEIAVGQPLFVVSGCSGVLLAMIHLTNWWLVTHAEKPKPKRRKSMN